jgi:hypothetical protein
MYKAVKHIELQKAMINEQPQMHYAASYFSAILVSYMWSASRMFSA